MAEDVASDVWSMLIAWIKGNCHGCAWHDGRTPQQRLWEPFGSCQSAVKIDAKGQTKSVVGSLTCDETAWLLKVIWYRSSQEIESFRRRHGGRCLDTRQELVDLVNQILQDVDLGSFGLQSCTGMLNPTEMERSHMPAFAVNAVVDLPPATGGRPYYPIECSYSNDRATHPYFYPSHNDYLNALR